MIRQDCVELNEQARVWLVSRPRIKGTPFKDWACKLFSLYFLDEQLNNKYYDIQETLRLTFMLYDLHIIDNEFSLYENELNDKDNMTLEACRFLGIKATNVRYCSKDYMCNENELEILKFVKPGFGHFVPGNGRSEHSWDSLGIRPYKKDYKLKSKRIITLKEAYNGNY